MSVEIIETSHETIGRNVLLYPLLRRLSVAEIINRNVICDGEIPYGIIAEPIILSRFSSERVPMYKLSSFCSQIATLYDIDCGKMNDDRVGRCLDAMHDSLACMKASLILHAIKEFNLNVNQLHTDITNILFEGRYDNPEAGQLQITYGHTKKGQDSRCKQLNFSLSVTADGGIPVWYDVLNGNTNDSVCYLPHLDAFRTQLGITSPLVVGDSKLVSNNNMIAFCRAGAFFIGPATVDEKEKKRLLKLWEAGACFESLEEKAEDNQPVSYWGMETERKLTDKKDKKQYLIRYTYIFSHQRRQVIRHTRAKNFLKAKSELHKIIRCLNKYDYKKESIIHFRIRKRVLSKCPYYRIKLNKDSDGLFSIQYWIDWQKLAWDEMFDGIYVLRHNLPKEQFPMPSVLLAYKEQAQIERCFETVKQPPIQVSPVWLHKPQRIESLFFCVFAALLLMALLQREARTKVWPRRIQLRPEGRDHLPLTANVLLEAFDNIAIYTITQRVNEELITVRCAHVGKSHRDVLGALDLPSPSHYLQTASVI